MTSTAESKPLMCVCGDGASEHQFSMDLLNMSAGIKTRGCKPGCDCTQFRTPPEPAKRYDVLDQNGDVLHSDDSWALANTYLRNWETNDVKGSIRDNEPEE